MATQFEEKPVTTLQVTLPDGTSTDCKKNQFFSDNKLLGGQLSYCPISPNRPLSNSKEYCSDTIEDNAARPFSFYSNQSSDDRSPLQSPFYEGSTSGPSEPSFGSQKKNHMYSRPRRVLKTRATVSHRIDSSHTDGYKEARDILPLARPIERNASLKMLTPSLSNGKLDLGKSWPGRKNHSKMLRKYSSMKSFQHSLTKRMSRPSFDNLDAFPQQKHLSKRFSKTSLDNSDGYNHHGTLYDLPAHFGRGSLPRLPCGSSASALTSRKRYDRYSKSMFNLP